MTIGNWLQKFTLRDTYCTTHIKLQIKIAKVEFSDVFSHIPRHINLIPSSSGYLNTTKCDLDELKAMLSMGVIEEPHSDWRSLVVLVPMTDGSVCFCVDFWKGVALLKLTLDLNKDYLLIPLTPISREQNSLFHSGLYHFVTIHLCCLEPQWHLNVSWTEYLHMPLHI